VGCSLEAPQWSEARAKCDEGVMSSSSRSTLFDALLRVSGDGLKEGKLRRVVVESFEENGRPLVYLSVSDPTQLLDLQVNSCSAEDYEVLKREQSLLVSFSSFPVKLVEHLNNCSDRDGDVKQKFELWLERQHEREGRLFSILEPNEFRTLKRLTLVLRPATQDELEIHVTNAIQQLRTEIRRLENIEKEAKEREHVLIKELEVLKAEHNSETTAREREQSQWRIEADKLRESLAASEQAKASEADQRQQLEHALESLKEEVENLKPELSNTKAVVQDLRKERDDLLSRETSASEKLNMMERLTKDGNAMQSQINELIETGIHEKSRLETKLAELQTLHANTMEKLRSCTDEKSTLVAEINRLRQIADERSVLKGKLDQQKHVIDDLKQSQRVAEPLYDEIARLKLELESAQRTIQDQRKTINNNFEIIKRWNHDDIDKRLQQKRDSL